MKKSQPILLLKMFFMANICRKQNIFFGLILIINNKL